MAHVLIVDDDRELRALLRSALDDEGYLVTEVADGRSALERLRASPWPQVVLLDLHMPRLDGAGVLRAVAGDRALVQRHRFILVTGDSQTLPLTLGTMLARLGVPLVRKPFDLGALLGLVAHMAREDPSTVPPNRRPIGIVAADPPAAEPAEV
jgi:CheY-like chemotaxis protein